jgi:RNA polymerase sigma-70 factor (ECF subfamily)
VASPPNHADPADEFEKLLAEAQQGSPEALGKVLEKCRHYLLHIANAEMDSRLRPKAGDSDLVQETFLEAHRLFTRFQGTSSADLLGWLRAILKNKAATFARSYQATDKRQVAREVPLNALADEPGQPAAPVSSPSSVVLRQEQADAVLRALERMPEQYREVIVWRQWERLPFDEIARRLDKTVDAARMTWWRAIERLRLELEAPS